MSSHRILRALLTTTALCTALPAIAQVAAPSPVRNNIDANGVDLFLGTMNADGPALSAGDGVAQGMTWRKVIRGENGWGDTMVATLTVDSSDAYATFGGVSDRFSRSGSTFTSTEGDGATLAQSGSDYTYTAADGTVTQFGTANVGSYPYDTITGIVTSVAKPDGNTFSYGYDSWTYCSASKQGGQGQICTQHRTAHRISSITSSAQYELTFQYANWDGVDIDPDTVPDTATFQAWGGITSVSMTNTAISGSAARTQTFGASSAGGNSYYDITDAVGRTTAYRMVAGEVAGITRAGSASEDVTVTYDGSNRVSTIVNAAGTTSYSYSDSGGNRTTTVTDPLGHATTYVFDIGLQRPTAVTNATGNTTSTAYDTSGRVTQVTAPEGNYTAYTYDSYGNVTQTQMVPKSGSGLAALTMSASYPCASAATCDKPEWTRDAEGNQTDYTYDGTTGNVETITAPAATTGGARPTTSHTFTTVNGVQMASGSTTCASAATCPGSANETDTSITYNSNGLPATVTKQAGDGSIVATTTYGYDAAGNVLTVDGPLSGTGDTTTYRYDADREKVGVIAPDPDGTGARRPQAERLTYDDKGRVTLDEIGTVTGTSDAAWAAFSSSKGVATTWDGVDRKLTQSQQSGGTTYGVTQYSYDHQRLDCVAVRMNSAAWGTLPSDACTAQTAGAAGPDRITKAAYDDDDRQTGVTTAYGTADASNDATVTYTANGRTATLLDANGNLTTYEYDGFDRLSKTRYPDATPGAGTSSSTDYEALVYDADGNVTSRRLRGYAADSTQHIDYSYDHLNRPVLKDLPGSELDVSYGYDLLGRLTSAATSAQTLSFGYDALGRMTTQGGPLGTMTSAYDPAGRRTRLTWPDAFYVSYDYDNAGNLLTVRENGATSGTGVLATYAYDTTGRPHTLTYGNGAVRTVSYDALWRPATTINNLAGTAADETRTFTYTPASQIASVVRSNAYAYGGYADAAQGYTVNGLNQATAAGGDSLNHDARGNTTAIGSASYTYSSENLLLTGPNSAALVYDPLLRLYQTSATGSAATRFLYDGTSMAGEYDASGTLQKRYVFAGGGDDPLVEYDRGTGGTYTRTWLLPDERGSVVSRSDDTATSTGINSYDEYGVPASGNTGRFGYTGQAWLPELGLWYYKARMYAPALGRFLQTDPIGYGDGANWYGYAKGDPVNGSDPGGLASTIGGCTGSIACTGTFGPGSIGIGTTGAAGAQAAYDNAVNYLEQNGFSSDTAQTAVNLSTAFGGPAAALNAVLSQNWVPGDVIVTAVSSWKDVAGIDGTPFYFADRFQKNGMPFFAIRTSMRRGYLTTDTISFSRSQALKSAKYINGVAQSAQPVMVFVPGTLNGDLIGLDPSLNSIYYLFLNNENIPIGIRLDMPTRNQPWHFNSGRAESLRYPSQDLPNHSYFGLPQ